MAEPLEHPTREELVTDLKVLREKGLPEIDDLELPALSAAAILVTDEHGAQDPAGAIEVVVRRVAGRLGGGQFGDAAQALFGLNGETRALTSGVRRAEAADRLGVSLRTFTRKHEEPMINQFARLIVGLCIEHRQRHARNQLAAGHPAESALALHWIERFQSYYRIWTSIQALGADLTGYRTTLLEVARPYDRRFGTNDPTDPGYSQEEQAEGYARYALAHYARFEWELRRFTTTHGGLWMLSDAQAEQEAADSVFRIRWHVSPFNERDQSFLRTVVDETPRQELHGFLGGLGASDVGQRIEAEWLEWCSACECSWKSVTTSENAYFPTGSTHRGISDECQVHAVIAACVRYCEVIDDDWQKIADWYRVDEQPDTKGVSADSLYEDWRSTGSGSRYEAPNSRTD